jgi:hypothetical protein
MLSKPTGPLTEAREARAFRHGAAQQDDMR